jgi:hypothetical protein
MRSGLAALAIVVTAAGAAAAPPASAPAPRPLPVLWAAPCASPAVAAAARRELARVGAAAAPLVLSPAPDPPPLAPERRRAGLALYDDARFDEARAALDQAVADALARGAAGLSQAELSDVYLYRALCAYARSDEPRAWEDFVRAVVVAPARVLDPARFPPKAVAMLRRAIAAVAAAPHGTLTVVAPGGARISLDGRELGTGPAVVPALTYGEHLVRIEHPDYATFGASVVLAAPAQRFDPPLRRHAPPDDLTLGEAARARGAAFALLVAARREGGRDLVEVRLVDRLGVAHHSERGPVAALEPAVTRALAAAAPPRASAAASAPAAPPPAPPTWYRRPWVWAVAGAAVVAAAVATPLLLTSGGSSSALGATLDLGGVRR